MMKLSFLLLVLLMVTTPVAVRSQQQAFTVAGIKTFDKAVPGQVMDVLIEGLNSDARGEQSGMSAPVPLEIVDEVLPPEVNGVGESTAAELDRLRQMHAAQKEAGREFHAYDPDRRYLTIRARGLDYNPKFVRITLEQGDEKFTLSPNDFSLYLNDALIVRLPEDLIGGNVKFTIENFDGERYSTPVTKSFVLAPRQ